MICPVCKKETEFKTSRMTKLEGYNIPICYSCWQKQVYTEHNHDGYTKWEHIKQNMTMVNFWAGEETILYEYDIRQYFNENFPNSENYNIESFKFFKLKEFINIDEYVSMTRKPKSKQVGRPGDFFGTDDKNYYIIKEDDFLEKFKNLKHE